MLDELLKDCKTPEDLLGKNGVLKQLTKDLMERMLEAEMTDHLATTSMLRKGAAAAIRAMAAAPRRCRAITLRFPSTCLGTATEHSSRS